MSDLQVPDHVLPAIVEDQLQQNLRRRNQDNLGFTNGCVQKGGADVCGGDGLYLAVAETQNHPE
eukprot:7465719-Prorocentrum_lima.AAC.1